MKQIKITISITLQNFKFLKLYVFKWKNLIGFYFDEFALNLKFQATG